MPKLLLALLVTLLAACAAPQDEDEALEESSDAVIAGVETFERPEIGAVWRGGGLCTGTLVRPNVVLTAAHCVSGSPKDEDVSAAVPAYAFEVRTSATERRRFAVDRIYSVPVAADFDGSQRWRARDIALLRLAEDVPASLAKPASIATRRPLPYTRVAVYGFGCTGRAPGPDGRRPGTGTKRKKEYRWTFGLARGTADTQDVCPGDSGGPRLDLLTNAVFGTTSGYVGGDDAFGDVPANHALVDAVASSWWPRQ